LSFKNMWLSLWLGICKQNWQKRRSDSQFTIHNWQK